MNIKNKMKKVILRGIILNSSDKNLINILPKSFDNDINIEWYNCNVDSIQKIKLYTEGVANLYSRVNLIIGNPFDEFISANELISEFKESLIHYVAHCTQLYNIDKEMAYQARVLVTTSAGYATKSVAQDIITKILCLCANANKKMLKAREQVLSNGKFTNNLGEDPGVLDIFSAKTKLGIIGYGRIGSLVGEKISALGATVLAYKRARAGVESRAEENLSYVLRESDILLVNLPLTEETRFFIGKKELQLMKDGVLIINCSRAPVFDNQALADALINGKVAQVAIDVPYDDSLLPILKSEYQDRILISRFDAWNYPSSNSEFYKICEQNILNTFQIERIARERLYNMPNFEISTLREFADRLRIKCAD
ncbi:MAG: hypothetical protein HQK49_03540 [Oligoflexia bacterium]|nr:hypothetical protein [Oligoflexia bacterium]